MKLKQPKKITDFATKNRYELLANLHENNKPRRPAKADRGSDGERLRGGDQERNKEKNKRKKEEKARKQQRDGTSPPVANASLPSVEKENGDLFDLKSDESGVGAAEGLRGRPDDQASGDAASPAAKESSVTAPAGTIWRQRALSDGRVEAPSDSEDEQLVDNLNAYSSI